MITLKQAKNLKHGQTLYHMQFVNADGSAQRWRVSGKPKTWVRNPEKVQVPIKHGMYDNDYLTENDLHLVSLVEPVRKKLKSKSKSKKKSFENQFDEF